MYKLLTTPKTHVGLTNRKGDNMGMRGWHVVLILCNTYTNGKLLSILKQVTNAMAKKICEVGRLNQSKAQENPNDVQQVARPTQLKEYIQHPHTWNAKRYHLSCTH